MKIKSLKKIINKILLIFVVIAICYNLSYVVYKNFNGTDEINLGKKIITTAEDNTMHPKIKQNDILIFTKDKNVAEQDIVLINNNDKKIVRIIKENKNNMGNTYIVKGDNNYYNYDEEINSTEIKGRLSKRIPIIGNIMKKLQSNIITIFSIIILIFSYIYNRKMEIKSKKRRQIKK